MAKHQPSSPSLVNAIAQFLKLPLYRSLFSSTLILLILLFTTFTSTLLLYYSFQSALIRRPSLSRSYPLDLQFGYSRPPFALVELEDWIKVGQPYDALVALEVPRWEGAGLLNEGKGNFMVRLELEGEQGVIFRVSKPSVVPPQAQGLSSSLAFPLRLFSSRPDSDVVRLKIPLIRDRTLYKKVDSALIEIGRADEYIQIPIEGEFRQIGRRGRGGELVINKATLEVIAKLEGMRYLMYHHPILSFVFIGGAFWILQSVVAIWVWYIYFPTPFENFSEDAESRGEEEEEELEAGESEEEKQMRRKQTRFDDDLDDSEEGSRMRGNVKEEEQSERSSWEDVHGRNEHEMDVKREEEEIDMDDSVGRSTGVGRSASGITRQRTTSATKRD